MEENMDRLIDVRRKASLDFMRSYEIRRRLMAAEDGNEVASDVSGEAASPHPYHPFPITGQVRLLSQTEELTYVLLLRRWSADSFLVVPFSAYSDPATDMELKLRTQGGLGLRVLQIWNARSLQIATLQNTWLVAKLPQEDVEDAKAMWQYSIGGEPPSEDILSRTGLPIRRRDDPRIGYQDEVMVNFAKLDAVDLESASAELQASDANSGIMEFPFEVSSVEKECHALAAAGVALPEMATLEVEGLEGEILLKNDKKIGRLVLRAYDHDGELNAAVDGWGVLDANLNVLGYFRGSDFLFEGGAVGMISYVVDLGSVPHKVSVKA